MGNGAVRILPSCNRLSNFGCSSTIYGIETVRFVGIRKKIPSVIPLNQCREVRTSSRCSTSVEAMADEDKKPRHKLGADELIEETHVSIRKIIHLLESNGLAAESVEHLSSLDNKLDFIGTLNLAKGLGFSMTDVPHQKLVLLLFEAWDWVAFKTGHTRKLMYRKVRLLEADNKTEPDTLERWKGERDNAERESTRANVAFVTMREIVKSFQEVPEEEQVKNL